MKRAYMIEMTVLRSYLRQLLGIGFITALFIGIGMQSVIALPAVLTMMLFMMSAMSAAAYDEHNGWGAFRLTMPLSRHDVVLGRYGVIFTIGCCGILIGWVATAIITAAATFMELPGGLSAALAFDVNTMMGSVFATFFCMFMGSFVAGIATPIYFRFGQTKATQYLPLITLLVFFIAPMLVLNSGLLDSGVVEFLSLKNALGFVETPTGLACFVVAAAVASLVVLAISAAVSLKLYERREL